jgi:hypothetical protein
MFGIPFSTEFLQVVSRSAQSSTHQAVVCGPSGSDANALEVTSILYRSIETLSR